MTSPPPPPPSVADPIDVNAASTHDLTTRLGLAAEVASAVIAERDRIGGFTTRDQLMTVAGVPPHVYAGIRDQVVVRGAPAGGDRPPTRGRRLEF
jgi:DNA uptake protein ComE-like DNA-binding protein